MTAVGQHESRRHARQLIFLAKGFQGELEARFQVVKGIVRLPGSPPGKAERYEKPETRHDGQWCSQMLGSDPQFEAALVPDATPVGTSMRPNMRSESRHTITVATNANSQVS